jgi:HEAT repeats
MTTLIHKDDSRAGKHGKHYRDADPDSIRALMGDLCSKHPVERWRARMALVDIGEPATPMLIEALESLDQCTRWEAAKTLIDIRDPRAAQAMVEALEDRSFGIRWLAAEGLIRLGRQGLGPLMEALVERSDSVLLREGAHHVLRVLVGEGLDAHILPVLQALENIAPAVLVPLAAKATLVDLTHRPGASAPRIMLSPADSHSDVTDGPSS